MMMIIFLTCQIMHIAADTHINVSFSVFVVNVNSKILHSVTDYILNESI